MITYYQNHIQGFVKIWTNKQNIAKFYICPDRIEYDKYSISLEIQLYLHMVLH